jgi:site-specific DNA-methyltransferase (adenine-specific)
MDKLKIEYVNIDTIKPYKNNAKLHPQEQIEQIKKSIEQFGMDDPIGIWKDEIVEGHGRLIACKELGYTEVPIIRLDHLTDEERKAYTLAHNKLTMNSDFDIDILNDELMNFDTIDMSDFGFDLDFDVEEEQEIVEDEVPEVPEEPKAKLGDIYQLGNHRLMCGDSTKEEDVSKLMNGVKVQMTFSDAPYNISFKGSMSNTTVNGVMVKHKGANQRHDAIDNDCMTKEEFYDFMCKTLLNIKEYVKGAWYLSFASNNLEELLNPLRDTDMNWKSIIIWMKNQATLSMKDYKSRYEPIVYGRFDNTFYGETAKEEDIWEYQRTLKNDLHPTMKPIPLICNMLKMSSKENDNVLDLFGGSGSTLIACEQLNRKCYMMELDPHYIDVIIQRWENFTGEKAIKLN